MKIISVKPLAIPDCKVVRYQRYRDHRGYFAEHFREEDFKRLFQEELGFPFPGFFQANESRSRKGVIRGLHFQWNPVMGKLVRTVYGRMVDIMLDVRPGSPTLGKAILYDMPFDPEGDFGEWIWIPPGFAHGNFYPAEASIEYFCTASYNPQGESGISPLAADIDFSLAEGSPLKAEFDRLVLGGAVLSEKDRTAESLENWLAREESGVFKTGRSS
ncbi:MAG: dTDP-4-dehydrorhamnose 3,5-epimerase family protein [Deltaproteobacteria bacterium]|jgi:dTDP-4-dehydrorhamnose 3,5-epimerase|nr:dTDP-4-dehydrorhamnose 3,5-epimerase family protein [Deltaproteobacteria bacterium]